MSRMQGNNPSTIETVLLKTEDNASYTVVIQKVK